METDAAPRGHQHVSIKVSVTRLILLTRPLSLSSEIAHENCFYPGSAARNIINLFLAETSNLANKKGRKIIEHFAQSSLQTANFITIRLQAPSSCISQAFISQFSHLSYTSSPHSPQYFDLMTDRRTRFSLEIKFLTVFLQGNHDDGRSGPVPRGHGGADAQVHPQS